jgi:hypothetical protein
MCRMTVFAALAISAFTVAGCSQEQLMRRVSGHRIGCPAERVAVTDIERSGTRPRTWVATCDGRAWQCSNHRGTVRCVPVGT